jgi:hypothetical protein
MQGTLINGVGFLYNRFTYLLIILSTYFLKLSKIACHPERCISSGF